MNEGKKNRFYGRRMLDLQENHHKYLTTAEKRTTTFWSKYVVVNMVTDEMEKVLFSTERTCEINFSPAICCINRYIFPL